MLSQQEVHKNVECVFDKVVMMLNILKKSCSFSSSIPTELNPVSFVDRSRASFGDPVTVDESPIGAGVFYPVAWRILQECSKVFCSATAKWAHFKFGSTWNRMHLFICVVDTAMIAADLCPLWRKSTGALPSDAPADPGVLCDQDIRPMSSLIGLRQNTFGDEVEGHGHCRADKLAVRCKGAASRQSEP